MDIKKFPHLVLLASDETLKDKLGPEIKQQIDYFDRQCKIIDSHRSKSSRGKLFEKTEEVKNQAYAELIPVSEGIAEYIKDHIKNMTAQQAAASQQSPEAKDDLSQIKKDNLEASQEIKEIFEDTEEFIERDETKEYDDPILGFFGCSQDVTEKVKDKNPNFGKKYKMNGDQREYLPDTPPSTPQA